MPLRLRRDDKDERTPMIRRRQWWLAVVLLTMALFAFGTAVTAQAQSRSLYWRRWDVTIDNVDTTANRFSVTEVHDIQFVGGSFRFGFRAIPVADRLDRITNVRVSEGGVPLQQGCMEQAGTYCVTDDGRELRIVYYFLRPAYSEQRVFTITYDVSGPLFYYEGGDQIDWFAIAPDHAYPIQSAVVTVRLPEAYAPRETDPVASYGAPAEITRSGTEVVFRATRQIAANEALEVRVQFPHNPAGRVADWQAAFDLQARLYPILNLLLGGGSIVLAIGGVALTYYRWWSRGRDPEVGVAPEYLSEPPSNLPPAVAGTLIDENAELRDVLSTIVDLARRGYLVIEENRNEGFLGFGARTTFTFKRTAKPPSDQLRRYEQTLLTKLFGRKMEVEMEALKNKFYVHIPTIQNQLYDEVVKEGFFEASPQTVRRRWMWFGGTLLALAVFGGPFLLAAVGMGELTGLPEGLACVPMALGLVGLVMLIAGPQMPAKTVKGAEEAAKWRAFRNYLQNIRQYTDIEKVTDQFNEYLPYAIAFGLERTWVNQFTRVESTPIPYWYYPRHMGGPWARGYVYGQPLVDMRSPDIRSQLARPGASLDGMASNIGSSLNAMSAGLFTMLNSASSTLTSRPSSSGGGGGGFSGGFSGGGGGGGGGSAGFG